MNANSKREQADPVGFALSKHRKAMVVIALFSGVVNLLALTGSIYMLQVYDRAIPSRSVPTLIGITMIMVMFYAVNGIIDYFRSKIMSRIGLSIDQTLSSHVIRAIQLLPLRRHIAGDGLQPIRDLDHLRTFFTGSALSALFDIPWVPIYLVFITLLHPYLGLFALAGAAIMVAITIVTDRKSSAPLSKAATSGSNRLALAEAARRNADAIKAMGMTESISELWCKRNNTYLNSQTQASDATTALGSVSKTVRLLLQSGILGLGAYLVIINQLSAGTIIAASIVMSRALAPIDTAIAQWRTFTSARLARRRLKELLVEFSREGSQSMSLEKPSRMLEVESLTVIPPGAQKPTIINISFDLEAGDVLGVIGNSGSGKSTLARALVGAWLPASKGGSQIRLDGASLDQWPITELGRYTGYLPQDIELLDGTIAENISRFDPKATDEEILTAARAAGAHDMIVALDKGYKTRIGVDGSALSGGQRQRIALARALFGEPFLVVLDEPNSNLDAAGEAALSAAIANVQARGGIVIVFAHRPTVLASVNKVLVVADGRLKAFGPRDEIIREIRRPTIVSAENIQPKESISQ